MSAKIITTRAREMTNDEMARELDENFGSIDSDGDNHLSAVELHEAAYGPVYGLDDEAQAAASRAYSQKREATHIWAADGDSRDISRQDVDSAVVLANINEQVNTMNQQRLADRVATTLRVKAIDTPVTIAAELRERFINSAFVTAKAKLPMRVIAGLNAADADAIHNSGFRGDNRRALVDAARLGDLAGLGRILTKDIPLQVAQGRPLDIGAYVQWVLRQCYLEQQEHLYNFAQKTQFFNDRKKALREQADLLNQGLAAATGAGKEDDDTIESIQLESLPTEYDGRSFDEAAADLNGAARPQSGSQPGRAGATTAQPGQIEVMQPEAQAAQPVDGTTTRTNSNVGANNTMDELPKNIETMTLEELNDWWGFMSPEQQAAAWATIKRDGLIVGAAVIEIDGDTREGDGEEGVQSLLSSFPDKTGSFHGDRGKNNEWILGGNDNRGKDDTIGTRKVYMPENGDTPEKFFADLAKDLGDQAWAAVKSEGGDKKDNKFEVGAYAVEVQAPDVGTPRGGSASGGVINLPASSPGASGSGAGGSGSTTTVGTVGELKAALEKNEQDLATAGDDAQMANVDLQAALQKLQELLQMMSNISKVLHDTSNSIIRNMQG